MGYHFGSNINHMAWDMKVALALWQVDHLPAEQTPAVAWDALEQGFDGPALRRLAALDKPTHFEVRELFPKAMLETGAEVVSRHDACVLAARDWARKSLAEQIPVEVAVSAIARVFYTEGYPSELGGVSNAEEDLQLVKTGLLSKKTAIKNARKELQALLDQK